MPYRAVLVAVLFCLAASIAVPAADATPGAAALATPVPTMVGGLWGGPTTSLVIAPGRPSVILSGAVRTTDGGASWQRMNNAAWMDAAFDPVRPGWVFGAAVDNKVWVSHNWGADWVGLDVSQSAGNVPVAAAVTDTGVIYLADVIAGIHRSDDAGATWTAANTGLPALSLTGTTLLEFRVTAGAPSVAYAVLSTGDVYKSSDGGASWSQTAGSVPSCGTTDVGSLTISPRQPDTAYLDGCGGVYRTRDGGASWTKLAGDFLPAPGGITDGWPPIAIDPAHPSTLYAASWSGVIRSDDGGTTWSSPTPVLGDSQVDTVVIDPKSPNIVFAGTLAGPFRSVDGGESWQPAAINLHGGHGGYVIGGIASDPTDPSRVYAATMSGIWRSVDGGRQWQYASQGLAVQPSRDTDSTPLAITVNPGDPATLYAQVEDGFAVSHDHGGTWSMLPLHSVYSWSAMGVDPDDPLHLIAPTQDGVATSFDGGSTWSTTTLCTPGCHPFERIAFAPSDPAVVYAAGGGTGLWRSGDGGSGWTQVTSAPSGNCCLITGVLAVDPRDPDTIVSMQLPTPYLSCFALTATLRISNDGGQTWHNGHTCMSSALFASDGTLYGTNGDQEYMSHDDGATVIPAANLPPDVDANGLALAGRIHIRDRTLPRTALYTAGDEVTRQPFIAAPPTVRFHLLVHRPVVRLRRNTIHLRLNCSDTWRAMCRGQVVLFGDGRAAAVFNYRIPVGQVGAVTLHLNPAAWRRLGTIHHRTYNLRIMSHGADLTQQTDRRVVDFVRER